MPWVLFLEDEDDIREIVEDTLRNAGLQVRSARNGLEALALLATNEVPSLILTDLRMPLMTGWTFIEHIRADARFDSVPIVVASSETGPIDGVQAYLQKPYSLASACATVQAHWQKRRSA